MPDDRLREVSNTSTPDSELERKLREIVGRFHLDWIDEEHTDRAYHCEECADNGKARFEAAVRAAYDLGLEEAAKAAGEIGLRRAEAGKRARAAGRGGVAECRQSDLETANEIIAAVRQKKARK